MVMWIQKFKSFQISKKKYFSIELQIHDFYELQSEYYKIAEKSEICTNLKSNIRTDVLPKGP